LPCISEIAISEMAVSNVDNIKVYRI
jgi:hypothetical protein